MRRVFILMGFAFIFMHLHVTGQISKYINMKYSNISWFAMGLLFFLMFYQWYLVSKRDKEHEEHHSHCHCHDHDGHSHSEDTWFSKIGTSALMIFPIFSVLFIPAATLNSTMIEAKGFNFPIIQDKDPSSIHQFLAPDTSYYYQSEDYTDMIDASLKKVKNTDSIVINDKNYLQVMELIYHSPGLFMGKHIQFQGFSYKNEFVQHNQLFLFRFGIIHCLADSGVYGMLVDFPKTMNIQNDQWIQAEGTLSSIYYQPFKRNIPLLKVDSWEHIQKPSEEYVYKQ
ncbi:TIGR03943 family putative permease subunit [Peribacillus deserti]|uniref:TIGR03943 family protein n=1 Tax=Peribacillus deserti TaxID=673318 RepID=A0A2N5MA11_9BACI|nr:TIGR03943 family protein [Peribacillus deserti]PLT31153.1 TIGR03943 family protein [Peribacillus deserti]